MGDSFIYLLPFNDSNQNKVRTTFWQTLWWVHTRRRLFSRFDWLKTVTLCRWIGHNVPSFLLLTAPWLSCVLVSPLPPSLPPSLARSLSLSRSLASCVKTAGGSGEHVYWWPGYLAVFVAQHTWVCLNMGNIGYPMAIELRTIKTSTSGFGGERIIWMTSPETIPHAHPKCPKLVRYIYHKP